MKTGTANLKAVEGGSLAAQGKKLSLKQARAARSREEAIYTRGIILGLSLGLVGGLLLAVVVYASAAGAGV